jgi:uncharacterized protein (DUF2267 family)
MSTTGLDVFDKTIQTTNIWLDEIMARMGPDRQVAWHILGAVLRPLRDRLPLDDAAHLGAQLPLLVRGLYYDQWHSPSTMNKDRHQEEFLARVEHGLRDTRPINVHDAARTVFAVLCKHVAPGQAEKTARVLPAEIRALWPMPLGGQPEGVAQEIEDKESAEAAQDDAKRRARQRAKESAGT